MPFLSSGGVGRVGWSLRGGDPVAVRPGRRRRFLLRGGCVFTRMRCRRRLGLLNGGDGIRSPGHQFLDPLQGLQDGRLQGRPPLYSFSSSLMPVAVPWIGRYSDNCAINPSISLMAALPSASSDTPAADHGWVSYSKNLRRSLYVPLTSLSLASNSSDQRSWSAFSSIRRDNDATKSGICRSHSGAVAGSPRRLASASERASLSD